MAGMPPLFHNAPGISFAVLVGRWAQSTAAGKLRRLTRYRDHRQAEAESANLSAIQSDKDRADRIERIPECIINDCARRLTEEANEPSCASRWCMHCPYRLCDRIHVYDNAVLQPWIIRLPSTDVGQRDVCSTAQPLIE